MSDKRKSRGYGTSNDTLVNAYMAEVVKIPLISAEEERKLLLGAKAGDRKALNELVSANLRFVVAVCWNFRNRGVPMPDLINEGNLALFRAAEIFEPTSPVRFMSYAVWWIRQAVLNAVARQAAVVSFPPDGVNKAARFRRTAIRLAQRLGREPYPEELDAELGGSAETRNTMSRVAEGISSSRSFSPESPLDALYASDEWADPDGGIEAFLIRKALLSRLRRLPPRQRQIISMRYGLWNGMRYSLNEVGAFLGLTRERVRQIEERALSQLRRSSRALKG